MYLWNCSWKIAYQVGPRVYFCKGNQHERNISVHMVHVAKRGENYLDNAVSRLHLHAFITRSTNSFAYRCSWILGGTMFWWCGVKMRETAPVGPTKVHIKATISNTLPFGRRHSSGGQDMEHQRQVQQRFSVAEMEKVVFVVY